MKRVLRRALCTGALAMPLLCAAAATPASAYRAHPFADRVDALLRLGYEAPDRALRVLDSIEPESDVERRIVLYAMASVEAQRGHEGPALALADRLVALEPGDGRAKAASQLIRAQLAENGGHLDMAGALAESVLPALQAGCPGTEASAQACSWRSTWRAHQILERRASSQGLSVAATAEANTALVIAEWAGDARRRATNLGALALYANGRGERDLAQRLIAQARLFAASTESAAEMARVHNAEARLANARGDTSAALESYEEALALATAAQAHRLEAMLRANMSDVYMRTKRPAEALREADQALETARRFGDLRLERVLINNAGIAKIGLGRVADGKRDLARLLDLWASSGDSGRQATTLLEFGQALAQAGDARGALELFHRERALNAALMGANREAALKQLRVRFESDARDRDIELLSRDNALKAASLGNRSLLQRIWWLLALVMLLAIALVGILYRRVRGTRRLLEASRLHLQAQSERDPLTGLANRRHCQAVMSELCPNEGAFEGALMLVDIDHFKQVNDRHGHAAGDEVLVEVARRLGEVTRGEDLVVRWGGEEFLVLMPRASAAQAEQVATRILGVLARAPVAIGRDGEAARLGTTASVGYTAFPAAPAVAGLAWERAVDLADLALYAAKREGRNRAVGITGMTAMAPDALRRLEIDFDAAVRTGTVTLRHTPGPRPWAPAPLRAALA